MLLRPVKAEETEVDSVSSWALFEPVVGAEEPEAIGNQVLEWAKKGLDEFTGESIVGLVCVSVDTSGVDTSASIGIVLGGPDDISVVTTEVLDSAGTSAVCSSVLGTSVVCISTVASSVVCIVETSVVGFWDVASVVVCAVVPGSVLATASVDTSVVGALVVVGGIQASGITSVQFVCTDGTNTLLHKKIPCLSGQFLVNRRNSSGLCQFEYTMHLEPCKIKKREQVNS